ncbi:hypothetical protein WJX73_008525 [Symbiochloris irregularis]|uniref:threonine--tRNA ligase n=1 Tax=Symbiochloris irregularis TaxID=706552 RepID=A0AAW1PAE8_9CHLO
MQGLLPRAPTVWDHHSSICTCPRVSVAATCSVPDRSARCSAASPSERISASPAKAERIAAPLDALRATGRFSGSRLLQQAAAAAVADRPTAPAQSVAATQSTPLPTSSEDEQLLRIRHSCSHIMAMAVQRLFPGTQVTVGPWIDHGFFYDFDTPAPITDADLKKIQKDMRKIIGQKLPFIREEVSEAEAKRRIEAINEPYKLEILAGITEKHPGKPITIYHLGSNTGTEQDKAAWWDLCAGPHVENTSEIDPSAVELESVAGAYWRGDENRAMLQRIYGTAWRSKDELAAYHNFRAEAARRDHRKLGQELDLFSISDSAGPGLVFWHPRGALVRHLIETFWKETHLANGYNLVNSPHIAKAELWKTSGHYDFYKENMFDQMEVEGDNYQLKPMNCPFHIEIYNHGRYSYRDLPLRWAELGTVYRYERSGTMQGLFRVRGFTQDDGHIFCLPHQLADEIRGTLDLVESVMGAFGFSQLEVNLSTRPDKSVGSDAIWDEAEAALREALETKGWPFKLNEADGAFYGPKIDINVRDAIGRKWQCSTVQLDFNLPERFQMIYMDADNEKQRPIMLHRAIFGSIERFFGILLENYAGAFPLWLAPVQVRILCITNEVVPAAEAVAQSMREAGIRVEVEHGARIAKMIRNAERAKTPVMCVVGKNEAENGTLSVRTYSAGDQGVLPIADVINRVQDAVKLRTAFMGS